MTNFEWYRMHFDEDGFVNRTVMECRFCPCPDGCPALSRKECEKRLREWCREDADED